MLPTQALSQAAPLESATYEVLSGDREVDAGETTSARPLSFDAVVAEHGPYIWRVLRRLGVRASDIEDVWQETFIVVHRKLGRLRRPVLGVRTGFRPSPAAAASGLPQSVPIVVASRPLKRCRAIRPATCSERVSLNTTS